MKYGCDGREAFSFKFYRFALAASSRSEVVFKWARPLTWPERPPINSGRRGPCSGSVHGILMGPFSRDGPLHDSTFDTITLNDLFFSFFPDPTTATTNASPSPALIRIRLVRTIFRCQRWNSKRPKRIFSQFAEKTNKQTNKHTQRRSGAPGNFRRDEIFNSAATKRPVVARQFFVVVAVVFCCFFYIFTELLETRRPPAVVCCSVRAPPPP